MDGLAQFAGRNLSHAANRFQNLSGVIFFAGPVGALGFEESYFDKCCIFRDLRL